MFLAKDVYGMRLYHNNRPLLNQRRQGHSTKASKHHGFEIQRLEVDELLLELGQSLERHLCLKEKGAETIIHKQFHRSSI